MRLRCHLWPSARALPFPDANPSSQCEAKQSNDIRLKCMLFCGHVCIAPAGAGAEYPRITETLNSFRTAHTYMDMWTHGGPR